MRFQVFKRCFILTFDGVNLFWTPGHRLGSGHGGSCCQCQLKFQVYNIEVKFAMCGWSISKWSGCPTSHYTPFTCNCVRRLGSSCIVTASVAGPAGPGGDRDARERSSGCWHPSRAWRPLCLTSKLFLHFKAQCHWASLGGSYLSDWFLTVPLSQCRANDGHCRGTLGASEIDRFRLSGRFLSEVQWLLEKTSSSSKSPLHRLFIKVALKPRHHSLHVSKWARQPDLNRNFLVLSYSLIHSLTVSLSPHPSPPPLLYKRPPYCRRGTLNPVWQSAD
jgi:hypothetical protein